MGQARGISINMRTRTAFRSFKKNPWIYIIVILAIVFIVRLIISKTNQFYETNVQTAIIVLGGGLREDGTVPRHTQLRLDRAEQIYLSLKKPAYIITLSGGTTHKPNPRDNNGFVVWEASAAAKRLLDMGIPSSSILEENFSLDTIGNAYFLRSIHIDPLGLKNLYVITNDWHMDRTRVIFDTVFQLPLKSTCSNAYIGPQFFFTTFDTICHWWNNDIPSLRIVYVPVAAGIEDQEVLKLRIAKEQKALKDFQTFVQQTWQSMYDLHQFLFISHNAYASKRLSKDNPAQAIDPALLKTY